MIINTTINVSHILGKRQTRINKEINNIVVKPMKLKYSNLIARQKPKRIDIRNIVFNDKNIVITMR